MTSTTESPITIDQQEQQQQQNKNTSNNISMDDCTNNGFNTMDLDALNSCCTVSDGTETRTSSISTMTEGETTITTAATTTNGMTCGPVGHTLLTGDDDDVAIAAATTISAVQQNQNQYYRPWTFDECYIKGDRIQKGSYGTVYGCHHKEQPDTKYAVKIFNRQQLQKKDEDSALQEVMILRKCVDIEHVIRIIDFFNEPNHLYVVQEYAAGGDVYDRLAQRTTYTEADANDLALILIKTVSQLHQRNIIHRDLKPENLLLANRSNDSLVIIADFGFAKQLKNDQQRLDTRCGTPAYVSPEIILGIPYTKQTDLWSIGCILFMLICGHPPFQAENHRTLFRKIRAGDFCFRDTCWTSIVTIEAKQLIANLLTVNPDKRWDAQMSIHCEWFNPIKRSQLSKHDLSGNLADIRAFNAKRAWKTACYALGFVQLAPFWKPDAISFSQQMKKWDQQQQLTDSTCSTISSTDASSLTSTTNSSNKMLVDATTITTGSVVHKPVLALKFANLYTLEKMIQKGSCATVWECRHKETNELFACKVVNRDGLKPSDDEAVLNEVSILQSLAGNKYVVQLYDFYEEDDNFYLVMEYMTGGDVFDRFKQCTQYTEQDAHDLAVCLLKAVQKIHQSGIAHRDIKPQNLLLYKCDDNCTIKIGDFGFAKRVHTPESLTSRVGTPNYVAPEILKNIPHDQRVDLWSVGVVIYLLLVGYTPFRETNQTILFQKIRVGDWNFAPDDWNHVSNDAKELIKGLLVVDPKERWTIEEALRCRWITRHEHGSVFDLSSNNLSDALELLRNKKNRLRNLARAFIGMGMTLKAQPVGVVHDITMMDFKSENNDNQSNESLPKEQQ